MMNSASIVVGYDGSPGARSALRWATQSAVRHRLPIRLVYAEPGVSRVKPATDPAGLPPAALIAHGVEQARTLCGGKVAVTGVVVDGQAAPVLAGQSERARMLVLGSRGRGVLARLLGGSIGAAVAAQARCPVVVVREAAGAAAESVVVAVDDSPAAQRAVGFALAEAAALAVDVVAVRVWNPSAVWERGGWDDTSREAAERYALEASLRGWSDKYPEVSISGRVVAGDTGPTLAEVSARAQLMVVGSRAPGGLGGLLTGSVSRYLLGHASCPLAVVPVDQLAVT
jgi:nucleotide-binding universal stress UspA family protein